MDITDIYATSKAIVDFNANHEALINNAAFKMAWELATKKSLQNMQLVKALLLIKFKYNISDFEFELFLENFDESDIFGDK
jgi:hypothetical protein